MGAWLVTGGGGFIGSSLVRAILKRGKRVRVLDNFSTGFRHNLEEVLPEIELIEGDIRDPDTCRKACAASEVVFHEAAIPSVPRSMEDPQLSFDANIVGTHNMLMAARDAKVRRFVFAASSSAYGAGEELPKRETLPILPISPYAAAKVAGEFLCATFYRAFGLETLSLRYFNVFGPAPAPTKA